MTENRMPRNERRGTLGFAASNTAKLLEKMVLTNVTTTYSQSKQTLEVRKTFGV